MRVEQHAEYVGPFNCLITYAWRRGKLDLCRRARWIGLPRHGAGHAGRDAAIAEERASGLETDDYGTGIDGWAMPVVRQFDHHPGREKAPLEDDYRSTTACGFQSIPAYVKKPVTYPFSQGSTVCGRANLRSWAT